jgi:hypothetical protein
MARCGSAPAVYWSWIDCAGRHLCIGGIIPPRF